MADHRHARVAATHPTSRDASQSDTGSASAAQVSVLMIGQRSLVAQRRGRFVAGSGAHPARMAPDLAAALIRDYTDPGDWVLDPLAGIGTTLVEAVHADRNGLGMEIEPGWVALARANIGLARRQGGTGTARIVTADATRLPRGIPTALRGQFRLVITSPPYGRTMHGRVEHRRGPLVRFHNSYTARATHLVESPDEANLAHRRRTGLVDGITAVLAGCLPLLAPGGIVAIVSRPWRRDRLLVDLPGQIIQAGLAVGLEFVQDRRASHAAARDGRLVARHSFFQLHVTRQTRAKGRAACLPQHDHVAVLRRPPDGDQARRA
ncbi:TRM11 family SAM-dependent methyltransferase [Actinoplanes sp. NPDC049668]|uniref:TRM11 family SAM-dependent methyltransferase n=1 Tax=unclassified Actinoplanes TaxID=2626549 RepID=UPI0033AE0429